MKRSIPALAVPRRLAALVLPALVVAFTGAGTFFAAALLAPASARAEEGFRCESGRLVRKGDLLLEVKNKCGDPDFVSQRVEKRKIKRKVKVRPTHEYSDEVSEEEEIEVLLDEWIYDMGPRRFVRSVLFENGRVIEVTTGNYGSKRT